MKRFGFVLMLLVVTLLSVASISNAVCIEGLSVDALFEVEFEKTDYAVVANLPSAVFGSAVLCSNSMWHGQVVFDEATFNYNDEFGLRNHDYPVSGGVANRLIFPFLHKGIVLL